MILATHSLWVEGRGRCTHIMKVVSSYSSIYTSVVLRTHPITIGLNFFNPPMYIIHTTLVSGHVVTNIKKLPWSTPICRRVSPRRRCSGGRCSRRGRSHCQAPASSYLVISRISRTLKTDIFCVCNFSLKINDEIVWIGKTFREEHYPLLRINHPTLDMFFYYYFFRYLDMCVLLSLHIMKVSSKIGIDRISGF